MFASLGDATTINIPVASTPMGTTSVHPQLTMAMPAGQTNIPDQPPETYITSPPSNLMSFLTSEAQQHLLPGTAGTPTQVPPRHRIPPQLTVPAAAVPITNVPTTPLVPVDTTAAGTTVTGATTVNAGTGTPVTTTATGDTPTFMDSLIGTLNTTADNILPLAITQNLDQYTFGGLTGSAILLFGGGGVAIYMYMNRSGGRRRR
jgi:hypothetical protein